MLPLKRVSRGRIDMKVIIACQLHLKGSDSGIYTDLKITGTPDDDLDDGMILLNTPEASIEVSCSELRRALKAFK